MENNWVKIYSSNQATQIEFAKSLMEEASIETFEINKTDSTYLLGEIELYVDQTLVDKAQLILTENDLM
jgi:hypothetical protein